jgi:hypothetical protein
MLTLADIDVVLGQVLESVDNVTDVDEATPEEVVVGQVPRGARGEEFLAASLVMIYIFGLELQDVRQHEGTTVGGGKVHPGPPKTPCLSHRRRKVLGCSNRRARPVALPKNAAVSAVGAFTSICSILRAGS